MTTQQQEVRWGVLGTAEIAKKFVQSVKQAGGASIVAVASRSLERAQRTASLQVVSSPTQTSLTPVRVWSLAAEWGQEQGIPRAYGSYEELLRDPAIDAVYIPTPTHLHESLTVAAAQHKKHVLYVWSHHPVVAFSARIVALV
jgi:predicted dehydrogenase